MAGDDQKDEGAVWVRCAREALSAAIPEDRIEPFLEYLQEFPTGMHNRRAAEAVERLLYLIGDEDERAKIERRLRGLRDAVMPPLEPDTWDPGTNR